MREPKWTEEQTDAHGQWRLDENNHRSESAADRDEFHFCMKYYANTPEGLRRTEVAIEQAESLRLAMIKDCLETAVAVLNTGEAAIQNALKDPAQHHWVKYYITISHRYSRRILEFIINQGDPSLRWHVMSHPEIRISDLEKLSQDEQCTAFVRSEAVRHLHERLIVQSAVC